MLKAVEPVKKDLVLVGGGHSHVEVLKRFGMRPLRGVRTTLVSPSVYLPYSGMLPGLIAGHYTFEEAHIDLEPLARFADAQFVVAPITGLDLDRRLVHFADRPSLAFDVISINVGSTPVMDSVPGARERAMPVKPVEKFLEHWGRVRERLKNEPGPMRIVTVGSGAGGVELTLAVQHRVSRLAQPGARSEISFHIVTQSSSILSNHNSGVARKYERVVAERNVELLCGRKVVAVEEGRLLCAEGDPIPFDVLFWTTHASAPKWIAEAGLQTDDHGFLAVNEFLQSVSHPFVFAAGDAATLMDHPRPKAGVFAVRAGPPLTENLRRACRGEALERFVPQKEFLSLISTGDRYAVASRGGFAFEGRWVWKWKDHIDRKFMRKYRELPAMEEGAGQTDPEGGDGGAGMRCGGCGSKMGNAVLSRVLERLETTRREDVLLGIEDFEDAAVCRLAAGNVSVQTVDFFRSFVNDPYVLGRIAATHALSDLFAMGASPQAALALPVIPFGAPRAMEELLYQLLSGAARVFNEHDTALAGGHTSEGDTLAIGFSVQGQARPDELFRKCGLHAGDALILTKPLGTGALFAADMRCRAQGEWIQSAIGSMLRSNRSAAEIFRRSGVSGCTDVTGFGLAGHLVEMLKASSVSARVELGRLPVLPGFADVISQGIVSSLQPDNRTNEAQIDAADAVRSDARWPVLFDPQTSGGLIAGVPADRAGECVAALREAGDPNAVAIGEVVASDNPGRIEIV